MDEQNFAERTIARGRTANAALGCASGGGDPDYKLGFLEGAGNCAAGSPRRTQRAGTRWAK